MTTTRETPHVHTLAGCGPAPLAAYLKGLAVARLIGEQADPRARTFWRSDTLVLVTTLDERALARFFLHAYAPTPLVTPWNGGSGFYPKDRKDGIDAIAASPAPRFARYREIIELCRRLTEGLAAAPKDTAKIELIRACRARFRGPGAAWLDAALVLTAEDRVAYPALLGTGGNDGRLDFTNNQMQRLSELIATATGEPLPDAAALLDAALYGAPTCGLAPGKPIGQFLPGAAGGANSSSGHGGDSLINPWDFVLMLEGAVLLQVAATRRLDAAGLPQASAPFAVRAQAGDYPSAGGPADESARGEQWMPLWSRPATLAELRALFAEGRLQTGKRRARRAVDAARAVARLGAARGVRELVRYGFIERNGQANLAVPLGRWRVTPQPHVHLLDELEPWIERLRERSGQKTAPASLGRDVRTIERLMMAVCREGSRAERWCELLCALGRAEDELVRRGKSTVELGLGPLPPLSPGWLQAADDGSAELRLAAAIASQHSADSRLGSIRAHCVPLDPARSGRFATTAEGLARDRSVVWTGTELVADLGAIAWRRLLDGRRAGVSGFELRGRVFARIGDINDFLANVLDDARIAAMARALMAVDWSSPAAMSIQLSDRAGADSWMPTAAHALFRLLYAPAPPGPEAPPVDPVPLRLLLAGRLGDASRHALRRVTVTLGRPRVHELFGSPDLARRLAASLCLPVSGRPDHESSDRKSLDMGRLRRALLKHEPWDMPADRGDDDRDDDDNPILATH